MDWMEVVNEVMPQIARLVASVVVILLTRWVIPAVTAYAGAKRIETLKALARAAYAFVEVQAPELKIAGEQKLALAMEWMNQRLAAMHLTITVDEMRAVIEEVWLEYNPPNQPDTPPTD